MGEVGSAPESIKPLVDMVALIISFIFLIGFVSSAIFLMLRLQAESSTKVTSQTLAGVIAAATSAPQNSVACVEMPGGTGKSVLVREFRKDSKTAGSVFVMSDEGSFRTDIPLKGFGGVLFSVPPEQNYLVKITKRTPSLALATGKPQIEIERIESSIGDAACEVVQ